MVTVILHYRNFDQGDRSDKFPPPFVDVFPDSPVCYRPRLLVLFLVAALRKDQRNNVRVFDSARNLIFSV